MHICCSFSCALPSLGSGASSLQLLPKTTFALRTLSPFISGSYLQRNALSWPRRYFFLFKFSSQTTDMGLNHQRADSPLVSAVMMSLFWRTIANKYAGHSHFCTPYTRRRCCRVEGKQGDAKPRPWVVPPPPFSQGCMDAL